MTDAPERIFASEWEAARHGKHTMGGYTNTPIYLGSVEYIRADLHAAAIARAELAEEALAVAEEALQWVKENPHAHREAVFSALAKIAALKGGAA